jgi:hypothetical protein
MAAAANVTSSQPRRPKAWLEVDKCSGRVISGLPLN